MSEIPCWIRGAFSQEDMHNPARQETHMCQYRVRSKSSTFLNPDYKCSHPGAASEYGSTEKLSNDDMVGVMAGGVNGYAPFCYAVYLHLTQLGEKPNFIVEGRYQIVKKP